MYKELVAVSQELTAANAPFEVITRDVRGVPTRCFKNTPNDMRLFWLATAQHGDNDYIVYKDERYTYAQTHQLVASTANWLKQQGIGQGDRVAVSMRNYPEWVISYWAIVSMGAVVVGMNAWWTPAEMEMSFAEAEPKILICDSERLQRLQQMDGEIEGLKVVAVRTKDELPASVVDWSEVISASPELPDATIDQDDPACIFFTSGTTAFPKGAILTHAGCTNNIMGAGFIGEIHKESLRRAHNLDAMPEDPVPASIIASPLFHVTATNGGVHLASAGGGKLCFMYKWDATQALEIIQKEQIVGIVGTPTMAREVLLHPDFSQYNTSSLRSLGGGGAALQPDLAEKIATMTEAAMPATGYGMTETCGYIAGSVGPHLINRPTSVGRALPNYEVKIVNDDDELLPTGEAGHLLIRGIQVIKGYFNREDATAEAITNGWLRTGDIAFMDEDEYIHLVDRAKEMVIRGGENIACSEVESAIYTFDGVSECSVFSVPDERLGEEVGVAIYAEHTDLDATELRAHLKQRIAAFKIPRYMWLLDEPLARNAAGKFVKRTLQESLDIEDAV